MPITFDTLDELKEFFITFQMAEGAPLPKRRDRKVSNALQLKTKRGKSLRVTVPKRKKVRAGLGTDMVKRRGRPPKNASPLVRAKKAPRVKRTGLSLTHRIQEVISKNISAKRAFSAGDIYSALAKQSKDLNKQSVVASVLKQMVTHYPEIRTENRASAGPRPAKVYRP